MSPALFIYSSYHGIVNGESYSEFSMGNMGYSGYQCQLMPFGVSSTEISLPISCSTGTVYNSTYDYGVNENTLLPNDLCIQNDDNKAYIFQIFL